MPSTLYRKYRPQFFKEIVDQNHIKITLINELESGRIAHAYLFSGPRGIGKTTTARLLAKALNCQKRASGQAESCNQCPSCVEINKGHSLDLIEIDAASHTGVDNVRENIINNSRVAPVSSKYKVFIIDEVHMLSISAFNALLKTLEEPPENVVFILATTELHKVPQTIISRCQRFDFQKVGVGDIVERLSRIAQAEKIKVDPKVLEAVALSSEGSVRDAESMLGQIFSLGEKEITFDLAELVIPHSDAKLVIELLEYLFMSDTAGALGLINRLVEEGLNIKHFMRSVIELLRKAILLKVSPLLDEFSTIELDSEQVKKLNKIVEKTSANQLLKWINIFLSKEPLLKASSEIIQLPLEIAVLEIIESSETNVVTPSSFAKPAPPPKASYLKKPEIKTKAIPKSPAATKENPAPKTPPVIKLSDIKKKWNQFLNELRKYNHSLALTLRVSEIVSLEENVLTLGFGYRFYLDRVWEKKNKIITEEALEKIFGAVLKIKCVVQEELRTKLAPKIKELKSDQTDNSLKEALDAFGGKVVE